MVKFLLGAIAENTLTKYSVHPATEKVGRAEVSYCRVRNTIVILKRY